MHVYNPVGRAKHGRKESRRRWIGNDRTLKGIVVLYRKHNLGGFPVRKNHSMLD